jgi:hypothetical protein
MEMKVIVGIILGLIALGLLLYFIGASIGIFDNILNWLKGLPG